MRKTKIKPSANSATIKYCRKCDCYKDRTEDFYQSKGKAVSWCKPCWNTYSCSRSKVTKRWQYDSRDMTEYHKAYYQANKEKYKEGHKRFLEANPNYYKERYRKSKEKPF